MSVSVARLGFGSRVGVIAVGAHIVDVNVVRRVISKPYGIESLAVYIIHCAEVGENGAFRHI